MSASPALVAQAVPAEGQASVQAQSTLVVVDVTAADDKHNPIHQLTSADFTILEDGQPQKVKVFEEHSAGAPAPLPALPKLYPGAFTNYSPAPPRGALNILLLDKLNTPITAQGYVRDQVLKYLKEAPSGTRIAIFALTTDLKMLQGFTSDPELLRSMVEGKKNKFSGSPLMNNQVDGDNPGDDDPELKTVGDSLNSTGPNAATILANLQQFEAEQQSLQLRMRQIYTLNALNQLARYMSNLPGRKNLIWFSGSFPINILPDGDLQNPFTNVDSADDEFRQTVDMLSRNQVAVYPIDARGLVVAPMYNASSTGSSYAKSPRAFGNADAKWNQKTDSEHDTMYKMADETGGKAFVNTNGLADVIADVVSSSADFYTISYTPENRRMDDSFRPIEVKVAGGKFNLSYRRGYYATDASLPGAVQNALKSDPGNRAANDPLRPFMEFGMPQTEQILFKTLIKPLSAPTETPDTADVKASAKGPQNHYAVDFAVDLKDLSLTPDAAGLHNGTLYLSLIVYDRFGNAVSRRDHLVGLNIKPDIYTIFQQTGVQLHAEIEVPRGQYWLRTGVYDPATHRAGTMEIPLSAVKMQQIAAK